MVPTGIRVNTKLDRKIAHGRGPVIDTRRPEP
jgi:hypothetical protein